MRSTSSVLLLAAATAASAAVIPGQSWNPTQVLKRAALTGQATFYGGNVAGGACSFSTYTLPSGIYGTALSDSNWADSAECGACVEVTGPSGNSITAMIVDECPGCGENHLDLFPDAFTALAPQVDGIIDISWTYTSCPITSALQLHNKEGVSAFWFSMQVVNAAQPVESLEVSTDGGSTWAATTRQTYNFFENSAGFGTTTVDVRVTSTSGETVVVSGVEVSSGGSVTADGNFGSGSGSAVAAVSSKAAEVVTSSSSSVVAEATSTAVVPTTTSSTAAAATIAAPVVESSPTSVAVIAAVSTPSTVDEVTPSTTAAPIVVPTSSEPAVAVEATSSSISVPAAVPTTLATSAGGSKSTSVIYVTVTGTRPGATVAAGGSSDFCYA